MWELLYYLCNFSANLKLLRKSLGGATVVQWVKNPTAAVLVTSEAWAGYLAWEGTSIYLFFFFFSIKKKKKKKKKYNNNKMKNKHLQLFLAS